jgi:2-methylcitrate dehydratase PrpD
VSLHTRSGDTPAYTESLAAFLSQIRYEQLPGDVVHAARRGVLDWIGCALAACRHPTMDVLLQVLLENDGAPQARVFGRGLALSRQDAAQANGQMGHLLDFDDTHMGGVILHASSPILSALFAAVDGLPPAAPGSGAAVTGRAFIAAYVAGFEAGVRIGQASPEHHAGGWHLTGTLGTIAAAAACGSLLGLSPTQMTHALGIAGTQAAGMQQNRGTMCKSFHAGRAGSAGLLAARLAARGFDSSLEIIEGKRGFCRIYSKVSAPEKLVAGLGEDWMIRTNGHKPHACGVVQHPAIDAMIDLRAQLGGAIAGVGNVQVFVHPSVVSITGAVKPSTGLHAKFSITHSVAVALLDGAAGIAQYSNERAADPLVAALGERITVIEDASLRKDQAAAVLMRGGQRFEARVEHASGTADNPMSDAAIEAKFIANAQAAIGGDRAKRLAPLVWQLGRHDDDTGNACSVSHVLALCA